MGNCCSDERRGMAMAAIGGAPSNNGLNDGPNDAVHLFLTSRGYHGLFSQIELAFSASDLRDRDVLSKSDPMLVVYIRGRDGAVQEVGRTEVVYNSLEPTWTTKLYVMFQFEIVQTMLFRLYDVDTQYNLEDVKILKLEEQQFLGEATCALSEIITKSDRSLMLDLTHKEESSGLIRPKKCGRLTVHAEECVSSKTTTEIVLRCSELEHKNLFSRTDPFLVISKIVESGTYIPVAKTEIVRNDLKPSWKPLYLNIQQVGSKDSLLLIECFNFNNNGKHDLIGKVQKSLADLEKLHSSGRGENLSLSTVPGHNHLKVLKSQLFVDQFSECVQHTFLDYLAAGFELNFMVAIDFTAPCHLYAETELGIRQNQLLIQLVAHVPCPPASNGNPRLPDSLHYIDPSGRPNAYQRGAGDGMILQGSVKCYLKNNHHCLELEAILEVGEVLQFYDSDKRFPAWGFGARPIDAPVSHCFNLNGSSNYCEVEGIQGIMMAYTSALLNVSLAGPTLFGPVISSAALIAGQSLANDQRRYFVLLIITDGVVTDLQETKDALVKASDLPLSILIVGVGGADFKEMEILDADKGERLESSMGRVATRDIVQFVPFRDVQGGEVSVVQTLLAELPTQFLTYMRSRNIKPDH